jgi:LacI family transcriptional regulator
MKSARPTALAPAPRSSSKSLATIRDVAARAGVSVATVSRVLNSSGPVRDVTSERIRSAVRALHYTPHAAARSLSTRRSHTICVLLPEVHGEFFSEVIRSIDVEARQRGYHLLVSGSHNDADEMAAVLRALRGRVDGLIVMSPDATPDSVTDDLIASTPAVFLNTGVSQRSIRIDNYNGAQAMTRHLIELGHRHIAFIAGPERNVDAAERLRGYRDALENGAKPRRKPIEIAGDFTEEAGYAAVTQILAMKPKPTAIFAANDSMAIGALHALREEGLQLPGEMALAGFDDVPIARYVTPPLTTVHVDIAELGRRAVEMLIAGIEGGDGSGSSELIATSLVIRESCGARLPRRRST